MTRKNALLNSLLSSMNYFQDTGYYEIFNKQLIEEKNTWLKWSFEENFSFLHYSIKHIITERYITFDFEDFFFFLLDLLWASAISIQLYKI